MSRELEALSGVLLDETSQVGLTELAGLCGLADRILAEMVEEGVLEPLGRGGEDWLFPGPQIARARRAARLMRDLELSLGATALVLELLDELEQLRARERELRLQLGHPWR